MLRDVLQVIFRRTTGRTDRGRTTTTTDGRGWTDDDDGTDDGTDGQTEDDDDDGTRRDERRRYPILIKKYIDGLPLEIVMHRHFQTTKQKKTP